MRVVLVVLFTLYSFEAVASETLDCKYRTITFPAPINSVYSCDASSWQDLPGEVTSASQNHVPGKTDDDVKMLFIQNELLTKIPENIGLFFKNLEGIHLERMSIPTLHKGDLKDLPNLKYFYGTNMGLNIIKGDIFAKSPELQYVDFSNNNLTNVGPGLFEANKELSHVDFTNNLCINTTLSQTPLYNLVKVLRFKCPPTVEMTEKIILEGNKFEKAVNHTMFVNITVINCRLEKIENDAKSMFSNLTIAMDQISQLVIDNKKFTNFLFNRPSACCAQKEIASLDGRVKSLEGDRGAVQDLKDTLLFLETDNKNFAARISILENNISDLCNLHGVCI